MCKMTIKDQNSILHLLYHSSSKWQGIGRGHFRSENELGLHPLQFSWSLRNCPERSVLAMKPRLLWYSSSDYERSTYKWLAVHILSVNPVICVCIFVSHWLTKAVPIRLYSTLTPGIKYTIFLLQAMNTTFKRSIALNDFLQQNLT